MLMTKGWLARTSCTFAAFAKPFAQGSQSINVPELNTTA